MLSQIEPRSTRTPVFIAADPFAYESDLPMQTPFWAPQLAGADEIEVPGPIAESFSSDFFMPQPRWPADRLQMADPEPMLLLGLVRLPLSRSASSINHVQAAGIATMPVGPRQYAPRPRVEPLETTMLPCRDVAFSAAPQALATLEPEVDSVPFAGRVALASFQVRDSSQQPTRHDPWPAAPFSKVHKAQLPLGTMQCGVTLAVAVPLQAGLRRLSIDQVPLVHGTWIDNLRALGTGASPELPRYEFSTPALRPRLRLAAGSRYSVATRDAVTSVATIEPENLPAVNGVAIPERQNIAAQASSPRTFAAKQTPAPGAAGLLPLALQANGPTSLATAPSVSLPQPLQTAPMRPASHLEPIDAKPVADILSPIPSVQAVKPEEKKDTPVLGLDELVPPPSRDVTAATAWMHVTGFWKHAPRDLKLLVFGIPILLGLALNPSLKKIPYTAPAQVGGIQKVVERNFQSKLNEKWLNVRQNMMNRAAVALDEDFRAGLDDWTSRGGTTDWEFDSTGFVRPGPLALYRPSVDLTDYQLQFLGMIDKKALSWVVRAADFDDYYVVKLVVLKPGPVPTVGVTRYAVIHGVAQDRADTVAYINAREDMLYRVHMDIHGDSFALTIQGQMVDSWSEPRLRKGGVGFFTARGEVLALALGSGHASIRHARTAVRVPGAL